MHQFPLAHFFKFIEVIAGGLGSGGARWGTPFEVAATPFTVARAQQVFSCTEGTLHRFNPPFRPIFWKDRSPSSSFYLRRFVLISDHVDTR